VHVLANMMMATVELLKYLWPFSWSFSDDIERDTPIHMEKMHGRPRSVKRRRRGQEMSSYTATAFLVIPGGVNALLPLYLPIYAESSRSVGNKLPKQS